MGENIKKLWEEGRKAAGSLGDFVPVDPGSYTMQLAKVEKGEWNGAKKIRQYWLVNDGGDGEQRGKVCNLFVQYDEKERIQWLIKDLINLGVDLDETPIDTADDLMHLYETLIEEKCCAKVGVKESKDGYINMRIGKRVELEDEDLVFEDPDEALKEAGIGGDGSSKKSDKSKSKDKDEEDEEEEETSEEEADVKEGDTVKFKRKGKTMQGEVVGFTDDDELKVQVEGERKPLVVPIDDDVELVESDEKDEKDEDEEEETSDFDPASLKKGDRVVATFDDKEWPGAVADKPDAKKKTVKVKFDSDGETDVVAFDKLGPEDGGKSEAEDEEEEPAVKKGDKVVVEVRGKEKKGTVSKVDGDTVKVKLEGGSEIEVPLEKVSAQD